MSSDVLNDLRARGFQVDAAGNKLLVSPASRLTDADRHRIRQALPALLATLASDAEWLEERAAILEFDAGMSRGDAELLAAELLDRLRARSTPA